MDSLSYLGVTITKYLKWNRHISNTCAKAKSKLGILYRHFNQADQSTLSSCTNRWCSHSWTTVAVCGTPHLLVLLISWNQFRSSEQDSVPNAGQTNTFLCYLDYHAIWPSLSSRRSRQKVTLCRRIIRGESILQSSRFTLNPKPNPRHYHHDQSLLTPFAKTLSYQSSFFVNAVPLWNSLPYSAISASSLLSFKTHVRDCFN